jgi:hypothetical protein
VASADRPALLARLPDNAVLREAVSWLWCAYDELVTQEESWRKRLVHLAQQEEVVQRFVALPGISWIRAATLYAYLDTPGRFRSKSALWKYLGIGLERARSGKGPEYLGVPLLMHRLLKCTILGAAKSAVAQGDNPFADLHGRWRQQGLSSRLARRNVARAQAATLWGMWKNGSAYARTGWCGCGRQPGDQSVSVRTVAISVWSGVPQDGLDPSRRSPLLVNEPASLFATLSNLHGPLRRVPHRWLGDEDRPRTKRKRPRQN